MCVRVLTSLIDGAPAGGPIGEPVCGCVLTQKFLLAAYRPRALTVCQPGAFKAQEMEGKSNEILMWNGEGF